MTKRSARRVYVVSLLDPEGPDQRAFARDARLAGAVQIWREGGHAHAAFTERARATLLAAAAEQIYGTQHVQARGVAPRRH